MTIIGQPFSNDLFRMVLEQKNLQDDRNLRAAMADREAMNADKERHIRNALAQQEMGLRERQFTAGLEAQDMAREDTLADRQMAMDFQRERDQFAAQNAMERESAAATRASDQQYNEGVMRSHLLDAEYKHKQALADADLKSPEYKAKIAYLESQTRAKDAAAGLSLARAKSIESLLPTQVAQINSIIARNQAAIAASKDSSSYRSRLMDLREQLASAQIAKNNAEKMRRLQMALLAVNTLVADPMKVLDDRSMAELNQIRESLSTQLTGAEGEAGPDDPGMLEGLLGN